MPLEFDLLGSLENEEQTEFNVEPTLSLVERPNEDLGEIQVASKANQSNMIDVVKDLETFELDMTLVTDSTERVFSQGNDMDFGILDVEDVVILVAIDREPL